MKPQGPFLETDDDAGQDLQGFAQRLAERYRAPLVSFFLRRMRDQTVAEDLAQETLLRVIARARLNAIDNPEAFLFRTAVNLIRDHYRRHRTQAANFLEVAERQETAEVLSPERVLQDRQSLRSVFAALKTLSEQTRDIFLLHRLENMKYREIADLYGISQSAVEKHMIKALAHIAKNLDLK